MTLDLIILFVVAVLVAYRAGWIAREIHTLKLIDRVLEEAEAEVEADVMEITIERVNDSFFAYGADDLFLGQGKTLVDLGVALRKRFPNTTFSISNKSKNELDVS